MRRWDVAASKGVDVYIANAQLTRERIKLYYGREAAIVHPPVDTERFAPGEPGDALLVVSEIVRPQAPARRARGCAACARADSGGRLGSRLRSAQGRLP